MRELHDTVRFLCLILMASLALPLAAHATEPVGFVASVRGDVELRPVGTTSWNAAALDDQIRIGDTIRTGPASEIKLVLEDDTTLSIGAETELQVNSYTIGRNDPSERSVLQLIRGRVRAWIGELFGRPSPVEVHTPTAVIGVKGTSYDAWIHERDGEIITTVCVTHGAVVLRGLNAAPESAVDLGMGICASVGEDGNPVILKDRPEPPSESPTKPFANEPQVSSYMPPRSLEVLLVEPPAVGIAGPRTDPPDPTGDNPVVGVALEPTQANEKPILDGEDPLYKHGFFEDPLASLSVRDSPPIVQDPIETGPGNNLQIFKRIEFFNFDTQMDDVRILERADRSFP